MCPCCGADTREHLPETALARPLAWEAGGSLPGRLFTTLGQVLLHPGQSLGAAPQVGWGPPIAFAALMALVAEAGHLGWATLWAWRAGRVLGLVDYGGLLLAPLLTPLGLLLATVVTHLLLLAMISGRQGFTATYRVLAYTTATSVATLLPLVGQVVAGVWSLYVATLGLAATHRCGVGRVLAALLFPLLVVTLVAVFIAGLEFGPSALRSGAGL